jgi:hypothetical protein
VPGNANTSGDPLGCILPHTLFLEVLILRDFKSLFPEVLILIDFKSFAPEVLILVGLKSLGMSEIREAGKFSEVLILGELCGEECKIKGFLKDISRRDGGGVLSLATGAEAR